MSIYLKQIEQLIALQKVDDEIHTIKLELEGAPKEVESLRARFADAGDDELAAADLAALVDQVGDGLEGIGEGDRRDRLGFLPKRILDQVCRVAHGRFNVRRAGASQL